MTAKQFLRAIREEQKELRILQERKEEIYYSLFSGAIRYDKDNIQTSPSDVMPEKVIKMTELSGKIDEHIKRLVDRKSAALDTIRHIDNSVYRQILVEYYLSSPRDGKMPSWLDVAKQLGYSEDWIKHLHGYALREFRKYFDIK